jgi:hypothetical protein
MLMEIGSEVLDLVTLLMAQGLMMGIGIGPIA